LGMNCAHLWYLPCLFLLMAICYPLFCSAGRSLWKHILIFITFLGINYFSGRFPMYYQLQEVGYYLVFFQLGYLVNFIRQVYPDTVKKYSSYLTCIILCALSVAVGYAINKVTSIGFEIYLSVVVITLFYLLMPSFSNRIIIEISNRSYGLYLFHSPLVYITALCCPNINPWLMLFINFVCFGAFAYLLTILLSKSKFKFIIGL